MIWTLIVVTMADWGGVNVEGLNQYATHEQCLDAIEEFSEYINLPNEAMVCLRKLTPEDLPFGWIPE